MSDRDELLKVLTDVLAKVRPGAAEAVFDRAVWQQLADLGMFALPLPADADGLGLTLADSAAAFEALGEALAFGPLVWTQLAAYAAPPAARGEWVVAGLDLAAAAAGEPLLLPHFAVADKVLTLEERGVVLYNPADVSAQAAPASLDPGTPVSVVAGFAGGEVVGDAATAQRLRRIGILLTAAQMVGIAEGALRVAVDYAKTRHQFGRPIGSFQALKHLLADAYTRAQVARAAVYAAAELAGSWQPGRPESDLAAAKLLAARAADANARTAVQVYGGMGFAAETPPHRYLKRAWVLEFEFGTVHDHALAVAGLVAADPS